MGSGWMHKVEIKEPFQCIEEPFSFSWLDIDNLSRVRVFGGVGSKVTILANSIDVFGEMGR